MRKTELLLVMLSVLISPVIINAQNIDSIRVINDYGIGNIILGQKINKKQLKEYKSYRKAIVFKRYHKPPIFRKKYYIEDGLEIFMRKKKKCSLSYIVDFITIKSPFNAITDKGVELGKSTRNDIIEKYGTPNQESEFSLWYYLPNNNRLYFDFQDKNNLNCVSRITLRKMPR